MYSFWNIPRTSRCALLHIVCSALCFSQVSLVETGVMKIPSYNLAGRRTPTWGGGGLVEIESDHNALPMIRVFNSAGQITKSISLQIPAAVNVVVRSAAQGPDQTVAVVGTAADSNGHIGGYMAVVSPDGLSTRLVRTEPYNAAGVTIAPDSTIWTIGFEVDPVQRYATKTNTGVLRQFDAAGILLKSFIPQSSLDHKDLTFGITNLASSSRRVGWYQGRARSYFEVTDGIVEQYPDLALTPRGQDISGLVILEDGQVFITRSTWAAKTGGSDLYVLDRVSRAWNPVALPSTAQNVFGIVIGGYGNTLILPEGGFSTFHFFSPGAGSQ